MTRPLASIKAGGEQLFWLTIVVLQSGVLILFASFILESANSLQDNKVHQRAGVQGTHRAPPFGGARPLLIAPLINLRLVFVFSTDVSLLAVDETPRPYQLCTSLCTGRRAAAHGSRLQRPAARWRRRSQRLHPPSLWRKGPRPSVEPAPNQSVTTSCFVLLQLLTHVVVHAVTRPPAGESGCTACT